MQGPKESEWFDIIRKGLTDRIVHDCFNPPEWWIAAAFTCIENNHAQLITSRDGTVVCMLRCWLSPPKPCTEGQHAKYESGDAVLLHWILRPDDIPHLHNHPWEFTTRILSGGYCEQRLCCDGPYHTVTTDLYKVAGDTARASIDDYHRIDSHQYGDGNPTTGQGGTWTLVTTGPRVQRWSFLIDNLPHDAETYLSTLKG